MDAKTIYFIAGFIMGVVLCAAIPKIPIGLRNLYLEYKKKQEAKKVSETNGQEVKKNGTDTQNNLSENL
ncbi:MAG TPA: hypothetical protein VMV95_00150 [Bacillota bacterium]|nr:hypothetical protein [Bacillota bacterium]